MRNWGRQWRGIRKKDVSGGPRQEDVMSEKNEGLGEEGRKEKRGIRGKEEVGR